MASPIRWNSSCCCYCCFISSPRKTTLTESRPNTIFIRRIKQLLRSPLKSSVGSVALNQRADTIQAPAPHAPHRNPTWSQLQSDLDSKQMRCSGLPPDLVPHLLKGLLTPSTKYTFALEENVSECQLERFALIYSLCVTRYIMHFEFVLVCFPRPLLRFSLMANEMQNIQSSSKCNIYLPHLGFYNQLCLPVNRYTARKWTNCWHSGIWCRPNSPREGWPPERPQPWTQTKWRKSSSSTSSGVSCCFSLFFLIACFL